MREKHENIENREFCKEIDSKFLVLKENEEREKVLEGRKYREDEFRAKKEVMAKLKLEEKRKNRDDLERSIVSHTNLCLFHAENSIKIQQEKQETRKSQLEFFLLRKETEHQDYIRAKRELHYETSLNLLSKYNISRDHSFQSYNRLQTTLKMLK